jgi:hypothetical protein
MSESAVQAGSGLGAFLPIEISGWKAETEGETYDPQTIFDYLDGAGEVYRSYNFRQLFARRYVRVGHPAIVVDFFDMGTPADAFGVFTHDLEGEEAGVGRGSTYKGGLLSFWKSRFFISVYAEEETEATKDAILTLARMIASAIQEEGETPALIGFLPEAGLDRKGIRYFHTHFILNYHFFVADENILQLGPETEAVLAGYGNKTQKRFLLIIRYQDAKKAALAYDGFAQNYMPDAQKPGVVRTEDGRWTAIRLKRNFLVIVFNTDAERTAKMMVESVIRKM